MLKAEQVPENNKPPAVAAIVLKERKTVVRQLVIVPNVVHAATKALVHTAVSAPLPDSANMEALDADRNISAIVKLAEAVIKEPPVEETMPSVKRLKPCRAVLVPKTNRLAPMSTAPDI